jgi:hypothetical protein
MTGALERSSGRGRGRVAALAVAVAAVVLGVGMVAVAAMAGHCSTAGGTCPREPGPIADDDSFRLAALGAAIAVGVPLAVLRGGRRRWFVTVGAAVLAGLLVGAVVRAGNAG